ncbi:hypothetical protein N7492_000896 [Penicillium capsulatum]|uniref:MADS-box domain-containing protein n=1 Tax=Penicillium capsulatum TaxID=69766 RepID=A0A9W9LZE7_9EURO|nr:hypothetical protein N7492_000896 [Penicillium capsulatum]KAJ6130047.1 hypothetical protein N7512_002827 [Penicillium capsulatum]
MAARKSIGSNYTLKRKSIRQKQCRRKTNLMKKAYEYSKMCGADVCVGIRLRETGQVHILCSDSSGFWAFLTSQLIVTDQDLEKAVKPTNCEGADYILLICTYSNYMPVFIIKENRGEVMSTL